MWDKRRQEELHKGNPPRPFSRPSGDDRSGPLRPGPARRPTVAPFAIPGLRSRAGDGKRDGSEAGLQPGRSGGLEQEPVSASDPAAAPEPPVVAESVDSRAVSASDNESRVNQSALDLTSLLSTASLYHPYAEPAPSEPAGHRLQSDADAERGAAEASTPTDSALSAEVGSAGPGPADPDNGLAPAGEAIESPGTPDVDWDLGGARLDGDPQTLLHAESTVRPDSSGTEADTLTGESAPIEATVDVEGGDPGAAVDNAEIPSGTGAADRSATSEAENADTTPGSPSAGARGEPGFELEPPFRAGVMLDVDVELAEVVAASLSHERAAEVMEAVARRVRSGEIVVSVDSTASEAIVVASVLTALLKD